MNKQCRINLFERVLSLFDNCDESLIENAVIAYAMKKANILNDMSELAVDDMVNVLYLNDFPIDIESIVEFFEYMIDRDNKNENGIVFTPKYISDFMVASIFGSIDEWDTNLKIIDPGCGCGIFLISAAEHIHKKFGISFNCIFKDNIFAMDIVPQNVRRCKMVLQLFCAMNNVNPDCLPFNVVENNSLEIDWTDRFKVAGFDFVIGNPPYVNTHDMTKETACFLKKTFSTTSTGVYNIFYAFIEHGHKFLSREGQLSFIVPNNFMTIRSARPLREFIAKGRCLLSIIDFADNMVFRPVRTYNCIITLGKKARDVFSYCVFDKTDDIARALNDIEFQHQGIDYLDAEGWKLVDAVTMSNIQKIESQDISLKDFVRTGIATLRDEVYFVNLDKGGYYKDVDGIRFDIESDIVKPIYKIPELKNCSNHTDVVRHIIFPYQKGNKGFELIKEHDLANNFPYTYAYLTVMKKVLGERDKGKENPYAWYAYGRTQGLNKYGRKLLFPTFAKNPNFIYVDDELSLFCNGYAVFENEHVDLALLLKILNSKVMEYYVRNTSYPIEGGYYCYQKKYIEKFSLPKLGKEEKEELRNGSQDFVDGFLMEKYALAI